MAGVKTKFWTLKLNNKYFSRFVNSKIVTTLSETHAKKYHYDECIMMLVGLTEFAKGFNWIERVNMFHIQDHITVESGDIPAELHRISVVYGGFKTRKVLAKCDVRDCEIIEQSCAGTGKVKIIMMQSGKVYLELLFAEGFYECLAKDAPKDYGEAELYYIENRQRSTTIL